VALNMAARKIPRLRKARSAAAGSWLALLAATTLGDAADTLRAEVRADGLSIRGMYRLVVQSFDATGGDARPVGSMQRSVTADELREGVHVNLLELRQPLAPTAQQQSPMVVAWVEAGKPDLEFDARNARPSPGSVYGVVKRAGSQGILQISLNRKA
jgi:hypothetical protein